VHGLHFEPIRGMAMGARTSGHPRLALQAGRSPPSKCSSLVQQVLHLSRHENDTYGSYLGSGSVVRAIHLLCALVLTIWL
jgi:hypothetical protein